MTMFELIEAVYMEVSPLWIELSFLLFFALGFAVLRVDVVLRKSGSHARKKIDGPSTKIFDAQLKKTIETEAASGCPKAVLAAWHAAKSRAPTPPDLLKSVVQAFVDTDPGAITKEIIQHVRTHTPALNNAKVAATVLDVVARAGKIEIMEEIWQAFQQNFHMSPNHQVYEVRLGGFAAVGNEKKVIDITEELEANHLHLTARGYSLTIKGFLKNGMVDAVLKQIEGMGKQGFHIPTFAITQFFRIASEGGRTTEIFEKVHGTVSLPPEAVALILEDCVRRNDLDFARQVEQSARKSNVALLCSAYDALLKLYTIAGDIYALVLFKEMQGTGIRISEGLCVGLLARCADTKFLRFAEEIAGFARERGGMTIAVYSALMKVYAYCGMYDKACDLYDRILEDGLKPDAMMYGCLMKFAVECGRTKLSQELSEVAPCLDIQNFMSLIRAAGRDKDVNRAFAVLEKLKTSGVTLDITAYNCVLDACVSARNMSRAHQLIQEMKNLGPLDIITYNTLLKGYCASSDLQGAKNLLLEMKAAGFPPNDVSYNCLINSAVSIGNFREAWETVEMMERSGVAVDHYTISSMMKALKKVKNPKNVAKVLALLDRTGLDVCSDEILLNSVLETCIQYHECRRLENILKIYRASSLRPSIHTYGSLIKACSTLKRLDQCREFWQEMEEHHGMQPNDIVLGCMLDALVCNGHIEEAIEHLNKWKTKVVANTVMYSTIIKGFANTHQSARAMSMWHQMRQENVKMNTVVYNAVIDAQARVGAMDEVSQLIETMGLDGCTPDTITYSTIVKGYCVRGDLDKAFEVFRGIQKNRMTGDSIIYNTILDGCTRHSRMDLADQLLEDMEEYKVIPTNFTLGILVKMHGRRHQLDKAFEIVENLPKLHGFTPNAQVWTCLMCACISNNAVDKALKIFKDLQASPIGTDAKAYGVLISGCVRHGQFQTAVGLVEEAFGLTSSSGGDGNCQTKPVPMIEMEPLEQLLHALSQQGLMEKLGMPLMDRLRAAKAPISGRIFTSMLKNNGDGNDGASFGRSREKRYGGNRRPNVPPQGSGGSAIRRM